jgi:hypothetical protein
LALFRSAEPIERSAYEEGVDRGLTPPDPFTQFQRRRLVVDMTMPEDFTEEAFFDYLGARGAALSAAVGHLLTDNVPVAHLEIIVSHTTNEILALAARIALYHRHP